MGVCKILVDASTYIYTYMIFIHIYIGYIALHATHVFSRLARMRPGHSQTPVGPWCQPLHEPEPGGGGNKKKS